LADISFSFSVGLVWRAVTGNASNLASGRSLSTNICLQRENKFSFYSCQASKPYNHKGFPRFHTRETIGKNFRANVIFRRRSAGKQGEGTDQVVRTLKETQAERTREREWIGKEWKGRKGMKGMDTLERNG
jgi:hypothetical protein